MKVLITGGSGRIGRFVVQEFAQAGHTVTNADLLETQDSPGSFLRVDLNQSGEVYQAIAISKADAVVHLGAWANAGTVPDTRTYSENVSSTFNVLQACADLGVHRVISASSAQVYGFATAAPLYVPVDEEHPLRPANCYALSKIAGEQAAEYFVNRNEMNVLSFRFMGVRAPADIPSDIEQVAQDHEGGARLLWTRTDARDAAQACRLAIEIAHVRPGAYNITGAQIVLNVPTQDLVQTHFGTQTRDIDALPGQISPLSCRRAHEEFGYQPQYGWTESQRHPEPDSSKTKTRLGMRWKALAKRSLQA